MARMVPRRPERMILPNSAMTGMAEVHQPFDKEDIRLPDSIFQCMGIRHRRGHRFLTEHRLAAAGSLDDSLMVHVVREADIDDIDLGIIDHGVHARMGVRDAMLPGEGGEPVAVATCHRSDL
jgi:hypothetical protein